MEISYTKQQQKQKQKQQNKNQDSDTMDVFDKRQQLPIQSEYENYFKETLNLKEDFFKGMLNFPLSIPIFSLTYMLSGQQHTINVYPTLQFLYSHHIDPAYITPEVKELLKAYLSSDDRDAMLQQFMGRVGIREGESSSAAPASSYGLPEAAEEKGDKEGLVAMATAGNIKEQLEAAATLSAPSPTHRLESLQLTTMVNHLRQSPLYTMAALQRGIYIIGMKDQFNVHDLQTNPLRHHVQYVADDMGFVLLDKTRTMGSETGNVTTGLSAGVATAASWRAISVENFGPYFVEQYMLMEVISKQEVAQNVLDYFLNHRVKLQRALESYSATGETQGKGFICWRFLMNEVQGIGDGAASRSPRSKRAALPSIDPEAMGPRPSSRGQDSSFKPGDSVIIHGLIKKPDLNSAVGLVVGFVEKDQRWKVQLPGRGRDSISIKGQNLSIAPASVVRPGSR